MFAIKHLKIWKLFVNDGFTDDSSDILKEYGKQDSRIIIISQENKCLSATINAGLKQVNGEYIYFLDSDDYIDSNALKELYKNFIRYLNKTI